ncbi:hypothetical protein RhiJN_11619 [Ceratobasidium sp. AG-Ba]|nr:hypothetical protein RhiJN_11619 [Ceratobasidium sp. AG-Ba]QRW05982.1 hypothetical protein RhiLY_04981 [Ceratobasidium sp. AG-Ba]QRW12290.1 hypothetical protein RhiLY_11289 [Ceratobasidium sp. AG-Ba]
MEAKPDDMPDGPVLAANALGRALLNFTHWGFTAHETVATDEDVCVALGRCLALRNCDRYTNVDLITPLLLPLANTKLERYSVSAIMWQIKYRSCPEYEKIDAELLDFFTPYARERDPCGYWLNMRTRGHI